MNCRPELLHYYLLFELLAEILLWLNGFRILIGGRVALLLVLLRSFVISHSLLVAHCRLANARARQRIWVKFLRVFVILVGSEIVCLCPAMPRFSRRDVVLSGVLPQRARWIASCVAKRCQIGCGARCGVIRAFGLRDGDRRQFAAGLSSPFGCLQ